MGATATVVFLLQTGLSGLTLVGALVTLCFTGLSRFVFAESDRKD
jgi:hypothetical protein